MSVFVGGLVGYIGYSSSISSSISDSYVSGTTITVESNSYSSLYVGGLVGYSSSSISVSYVSGDVVLVKNDQEIDIIENIISINQLDDSSFYIDILGWHPEIWNIEDLDYNNGKYPTFC